jgi:hypothetical protein
MKTRILVLASCLLAFASQAQESTKELWTWRDANGVVHFSDTPGPGATRVDLVVPGAPSGGATAPARATASTVAKPPAAPGTTYNRLEIWQPENGASFFEADAAVSLRIRSEPQLSPGDRLLTYLDGKLLPGENALEQTLTGLDRGVHSASSVILARDGTEKIRSAPVVFHMKPPTASNPRNQGPALRPAPPKPAPRPAAPRGG